MSPRPRTVSDDEILNAAAGAVGSLGPLRLTIAHIAKGCGLSPATIIQRFGSKSKLLRELANREAASAAVAFAEAFRPDHGPIDQLIDALCLIAARNQSPDQTANKFALLHIEAGDPNLHDQLVRHAGAELAEILALIEEAVADGELMECDPPQLARTILALKHGVLATWALDREGDAPSRMRSALRTVIDPYRSRPRLR